MNTNELFSTQERKAYLKAETDAKENLKRQKIEASKDVPAKDRQKIKNSRGRPLKFKPDEIMAAWESYCFTNGWSESLPSIKDFCKKFEISISLFRKIRADFKSRDEHKA